MYDVLWQLEYGAGLLRTEPPEGETILHAPKGYKGIRLCNQFGEPLVRMDIPEGGRPIFYRQRSLGISSVGQIKEQTPRLDAIVFGVATDVDNDKTIGNVKLFLWRNNQAVNCPKENFDETTIMHLLLSPIGV